MNARGLEMIAPQRAHYYADVDNPRINFLARPPSSSCAPAPWLGSAGDLALHATNSTCPTDCLSGSALSSSVNIFNKELHLESSVTWQDAPASEPASPSEALIELAPSFPKAYVPFRDLLDSSKKMSAARQATPLCTAWITFSDGAQVDSVLVLNSSLSVAVQFFSDSSRAPRLRTIAPTKPLLYNIHDSGVLVEFQSAAIPPLWSGDPRFNDPKQRVTFASWNFWREHAPAASPVSTQCSLPSFCTSWSTAEKAFRFHFLSNGDLVVVGTTSGFVCRGASIIQGRQVAISAFEKFKACTDEPELDAVTHNHRVSADITRQVSIYSFCRTAFTFENLPAKNAWKSGENLYDRLIISNWAPKLNKLVSLAALDVPASDVTTKATKHLKRGKVTIFDAETGDSTEQTWEEFQELESQRELNDRIYAQKLQDQELAALRLSALRSRRDHKNKLHAIDRESRIPSPRRSKHEECLNLSQPKHPQDCVDHIDISHDGLPASVLLPEHSNCSPSATLSTSNTPVEKLSVTLESPSRDIPSTSLSCDLQPNASSDSDTSDSSPRSSCTGAKRTSSTASAHKIRFVFKNDHINPIIPKDDSPSISEATLIRSQNLFQVGVGAYLNAVDCIVCNCVHRVELCITHLVFIIMYLISGHQRIT